MIISDWVTENYTNHGEFCDHYSINCTDNVIRMYGYKIATIHDDYVIIHECLWLGAKNADYKDVTLYAADPKFFQKLKRRLNRRMKLGVA